MRFLCISHFTTHHKQLLHYWTNVNRRQLIVERDIVRSIHNDSDEWCLETGESFHVLILTTINYLAFVKTKTYFGRIIEFFLKWARFIKKGGKKRRNEKNKKMHTFKWGVTESINHLPAPNGRISDTMRATTHIHSSRTWAYEFSSRFIRARCDWRQYLYNNKSTWKRFTRQRTYLSHIVHIFWQFYLTLNPYRLIYAFGIAKYQWT